MSAVVTATAVCVTGYAALGVYTWRHRTIRGAREVVLLMAAVTLWSTCYAFELSSDSVPAARRWASLEFVGAVALGPAMWAFVTEYIGRGRMPRATLAWLTVEPALVLTLLALPGTRDLIIYYPAPGDGLRHLGPAPVPEFGPLFWPHAAYTYALLLSSIGVLSARLIRVAAPYRRAAYLVIAATVTPLLANVLYSLDVFGTVPDPTPLLFMLGGVVLVWGLLRLRLLDVPLLTRSLVVERILDGVLLLDAWGRIVDANPAAARFTDTARTALVGRSLRDVAPQIHAATITAPTSPDAGAPVEIPARLDDGTELAVSVTDVTDRGGRATARILLLRDVTDRRRAEEQLQELLTERTLLLETLEANLRPGPLPDVPGLALTGRWLPGTRGSMVSGDFYDVHPAGPGRWAFVLGDVSGKGAQAAVVTSMVRHTVQTLSAQSCTPPDVLGQLNRALLNGGDPERFCTVTYGHISYPPGTGVVRVELALGGHPPPLLRRADGQVCAIGVPGTALGLLDEIDVRTTSIDLAAGDVLFAYTDGVTETRRGDEEFGEQRLAAAFAGAIGPVTARTPPGDGAAGLGTAADVVMEQLRAFADTQDDIALLLLGAR